MKTIPISINASLYHKEINIIINKTFSIGIHVGRLEETLDAFVATVVAFVGIDNLDDTQPIYEIINLINSQITAESEGTVDVTIEGTKITYNEVSMKNMSFDFKVLEELIK